ncbi:transcriptional regulator, CarD family [Alkaliphilus metalliredigens QYMF]|uniref:Transcriptional regulator, CarD family n=2 Tax=Alkaliphilus TaxID=114627 RepID=A6TWL2_ALKMQ|nr:transcriptional regulator, CarD family [Alkaliphilus metalliredigens QYMF]
MFNIGDKIVYPMHGAGVIEAIEEKEILGKKRKYYIMKMPLGDMQVMIPLDHIEEVGIRSIIGLAEVEQVFAVLAADTTKMPQNWNRRYRANMDLIKGGDIYAVAEVVRNLLLRDREKGLSTGERKMLNNAKQILVSEVVLSTDKEEQEVLDWIENVVQE